MIQVLESFRKYLDPHVFLQFAKGAPALQRVAALARTGLVDQLEEELKNVPKAPQGLVQSIRVKLEQAKKEILTEEVAQFLGQLSDLQQIENFTLEEIKSKYPFVNEKSQQKLNKQQMLKIMNEKVVAVNSSIIEKAFKASQLYYDMGQYERSLHIIDQLQYFIDTNDRFDHIQNSVYWGRINLRLVTQLLTASKDEKKFQIALDELKRLPIQNLVETSTVLHIATVLVFGSPDPAYDAFLEQYATGDFQKALFSTAQTLLPHFFVAALLGKNTSREFGLESVAQLLESNNDLLNNPIAEFIYQLLSQFDFDRSNELISDLARFVEQDPLLSAKKDQIVRGAQILHFQTYLGIFSYVSIKSYSKFLKQSEDETEIWLVDAIRTLNVQAKIEGDRICVLQQSSEGQLDQIMNQVKEIIPKTNMLITNLDRLQKIQ